MKVRVYFNLHKRLFSVLDVKTRRVVEHRFNLVLTEARFIVSERGRQRVLRDRRKNVHAFVEGYLAPQVPRGRKWRAVSYNPYKAGHFFAEDNPEFSRIGAADAVSMSVVHGKPTLLAIQ
jgi:hypothetical protein